MSEFYSGSHFLSSLESFIGLSVDKINFIACQLLSIGLGLPFQKFLPPHHYDGASNSHRYLAALLMGAALCLFCFGPQILHILLQAGVCQLLILYAPPKSARFLVSGFAIGYLSLCHILRLYYDFGGYTLDVTGPLMIQTQRLSSLAFNLHDGMVARKGSDSERAKLTPSMMKHKVCDTPSFLHYWSYILHFQGILVGPFVFFCDFKHFMEGTVPMPIGVEKPVHEKHLLGWSRIRTVLKWTVVFAIVSLTMPSIFGIEFMSTEEYASCSLPYKWLYLMLAAFVIRHRYYFAWSLGELSYLCSGCGYSGLNPITGQPEYKIVQNFDFVGVELATSMKLSIDNWNIGTTHWLRECIYERVPGQHATMAVFFASAAWHGFYPGYYLMFVSTAFFTFLARMTRRKLRPMIINTQSQSLLNVYHVITGVAALTTLNYLAGAFCLMEMMKIYQFWKATYFGVHAVSIVQYIIIFHCLPGQRRQPRQQQQQQQEPQQKEQEQQQQQQQQQQEQQQKQEHAD